METTEQPCHGTGIMVFRPTIEEFADFSAYIQKMEDCGAHKFGIAKVIPPKEWYASKHYDMEKIGDMVIDSPIAQLVTGQQGVYQQFNVQQKPLTVRELKEMAESDKYRPPEGDVEKVERAYWKNITFNPPIYGADVAGSIYDPDVQSWNINHLNTILDLIESEKNVKILGVNTAYLYFGMWKTSFAWHTEDMDLYSINYLHFGASKSWYAIPPEHGKRLETLAAGFFPGSARTCSQFLRHKMTVISPHMLKKYSIPFYRMTQHAGEFMITFPYGYHSGYNQGYNCAESTNFASLRWIDFGKRARPCTCRTDNVKIEMAIFVKKYQPKQYEEYMEGVAKKKQSTGDQIDDDKKEAAKKQEKNIKMKRYNRYPSLSGVRSLAKHVKKETEQQGRPTSLKSQKRQAIKKAKDLLKRAEKARRESIGKSSHDEDDKLHGLVLPSKNEKTETTNASMRQINTPTQDNVSPENGEVSERMRKLLEIKQEMERDNERKKVLQKGKTTRERRQKFKEDRQSSRIRGRVSKASPPNALTKPIANDSTHKHIPHERKTEVLNKSENPGELHGLWVGQEPNAQAETTYNRFISRNGNRCAVCAYFDPDQVQDFKDTSLPTSTVQPEIGRTEQSTPIVAEVCFMKASPLTDHDYLPEPILPLTSQLFTCRACWVTVHESCYGIDEATVDRLNWYCNRCQPTPSGIPAIKPVRCELCPMRGGALKMTTMNRWVHIVCALAFCDVSFVNVRKRGPIDLSRLNLARTKLKCNYCRRSSNGTTNNGACVQCAAGKCAQSFHVTCSFHNGVSLHAGDWPLPVESYCQKHDRAKCNKVGKRLRPEIQPNAIVYAKHKNGRYYQGRVESVDSSIFYYVIFEDGSFCHDLPPEDIVNFQPGVVYSNEEKVDVLWTDGIIYPSVVKSRDEFLRFDVVFEDGSMLSLKRGDIYRQDEELPKRVRSKLSCATETANLLWQASDIQQSQARKAKLDNKRITMFL